VSSFFEPVGSSGSTWRATALTTGPWDPRFQHGGPPSALLGRAVEQCAPRPDMVVARVTVEILGAIPVAELELRSQVVRPGRSVELVEAVLSAGGRDVAHARAWRVLRTEGVRVEPRGPSFAPLPDAPDEGLPEAWGGGYLQAVEWRVVSGHWTTPGPASAWTRLRHPLVPDEEPSGLQRVLAVADSGNGLSSELDLRTWHFINPELTVHLHREPVGEWVGVDAVTAIGDTGLATTRLVDQQGLVGVGAQSLLVAARP
jgi:hypothetical protein